MNVLEGGDIKMSDALYLIPKEKIEEFEQLLREFGINFKKDPKFEKFMIKGQIRYMGFPNQFWLYHNKYKGLSIYLNECNELYIHFFNELLGDHKSLGPLKKENIQIHYHENKLIIEFF